MILNRFALLLSIALASGDFSSISAQVLYGGLNGNVTDPGGGAIAGAAVSASNARTGLVRQTATNEAGEYNFADLEPGTYLLKVTKQGFQTSVTREVAISANNLIRFDAALQIGAVTESVTVDARPPEIQSDRADVRFEMDTESLDSLPVPVGRDYQNLLRIIPGVSVSGGGAIRGSNPSGSLDTFSNGSGRTQNTTTIDGATSANTYDTGIVAYVPSLDAIETLDVVTGNFGASTGLAGGAAVSLHIKSGTNRPHGSLFEYHSDNAMQARPVLFPVDSRQPKYIFNQYGGTFGGPIIRSKLFYFGSFEGTAWRQTYSTYATVPTAVARSGNLAEGVLPIYDPATGTSTGAGRQAFTNNIIPLSRFSPISQKIIAMMPAQNRPGLANNYFVAATAPYDRYTGDGKINWNVNEKLSVFARAGLNRFDEYNQPVFGAALQGPVIDGQQTGTANGGVDSFTGAATYIITPRLIVDGYFGYIRSIQNAYEDNWNKNIGLDVLGIPGTNGKRPFEGGFPAILLDGYTQVGISGRSVPWFRVNPSYQYTANFNWTKGKHNVRWGVDVAQRELNFIEANVVGATFGAQGGFQFSNGVTQVPGGPGASRDNAFAAFLLGFPQQMGTTLSVPDEYGYNSRFYGLFVQDQWNVTPRLTLNLGVRWEYFPLANRADRGLEIYDPATNQMAICGKGSVPGDCGVSISGKLFSPRIGVAWRPSEKLVVRAGYGITSDPYDPGPQDWFQNFPIMIANTIPGATSYLSPGNWANGIPLAVAPDLSGGHVPVPGTAIVYTIPHRINRGYIESWNVSIQRQLFAGWVGQASYVANHGVRLMGVLDQNAGQIIGAGTAGEPLNQRFGRTASTYLAAPGFSSTYNSLQVILQRRFSHGLQLMANYTWSKAIGTNNGTATPSVQALQYMNLNRAVLNFNRGQVFNLTGVWNLPFGEGQRWLSANRLVAAAAGGWRLNALFSAMPGLPFTVTSSGTSLNLPGSSQRANQVKPRVEVYGGTGPGQYYFDPLAYAPVNSAQFGNAGFDSIYGPGLMNCDVGLFRQFTIREKLHLQFRAEAFNSTNTPHWANPAANVSSLILNTDGTIKSSGGFAQITGTNSNNLGRGIDQRTFRLGLRLSF